MTPTILLTLALFVVVFGIAACVGSCLNCFAKDRELDAMERELFNKEQDNP